jgi:hypothetical protein
VKSHPLEGLRGQSRSRVLHRGLSPSQRLFVLNGGHLSGGRPLPGEVVDHIVAKADGVPLYVEELTKAILGSGVLEARGDAYVLTGALAQLHIPETLQDSLMARLDRAPRLREVAQLGAVLGRRARAMRWHYRAIWAMTASSTKRSRHSR